jgi:hypothetical protein
MNPHLQYGQAIPGRTEGRGIGIIDTARLVSLVDAVGLLNTSEFWSEPDRRRLEEWFREYLAWLQTSAHGKAERATKNNHAVWYDVQVADFALFVGERSIARSVLEQVGPQRIATQIKPDGSMPHELARTKSFSYTHMNLRGFLHLARLGEHVDVDLWNYRSSDGRSIQAALDWLEPYVRGTVEWKWRQISTHEPMAAWLLYRRAAARFPQSEYGRLGTKEIDPVTDLLWPSP